jgi:DNA repair protein RecO (recombination protein O)
MTANKIELQPAYILHTRNYRDSSLLVEALTSDHGRVSAVLRGVKASGKAAQQKRSLVQPFVPVLISWHGKTDLKTLTHLEANGAAVPLQAKRLFSALYINELLTRMLQHYEAQQDLFPLYEWVLQSLLETEFIDVVLRRFELQLLDLMGYGLEISHESQQGDPVKASAIYSFYPDHGLEQTSVSVVEQSNQFRGADLLALASNDFKPEVRQAAKRLCRLALQPHLGNKPLKSRELFA